MVEIFQYKELTKEALVQLIEIERDKINFYGSFMLPLCTGIIVLSVTTEYQLVNPALNFALIIGACFLVVLLIFFRLQSQKRILQILYFLKK